MCVIGQGFNEPFVTSPFYFASVHLVLRDPAREGHGPSI